MGVKKAFMHELFIWDRPFVCLTFNVTRGTCAHLTARLGAEPPVFRGLARNYEKSFGALTPQHMRHF